MIFYDCKEIINPEYFRNKKKYIQRRCMGPKVYNELKSISFVTRCMNRLNDLKKTLPKNLEDNKDYPNLEFVILDYNSTDGLGSWIRKDMFSYIESGRLNYYHTVEPANFCPNHSQNVAFRLANNELVANIDSDNYTHSGYAHRLNECASFSNSRLLIVPENFLLQGSRKLFLKGRFGMFKKDIEWLRGFDEDLDEGFGNDDVNFVLRAMLAGFKIVCYEYYFAEDRLPTTDAERILLVKNKDFYKTKDKNGRITWDKLGKGKVVVNQNRSWGKCRLVKNFNEEIIL